MAYYEDKLKGLLDNPGSYSATPGFKFALDTGLEAINRNNSAMRSSGNVLADLMKYGTGLAQQDYAGTRDFLGKMTGQDQQYQLGQGQNANAAESNRLTGQRDSWNNANTQRGQGMDFGLGIYRTALDNSLGRDRLALDASTQGDTNALNWFRANTDRGRANADAYYTGQDNNRRWYGTFF